MSTTAVRRLSWEKVLEQVVERLRQLDAVTYEPLAHCDLGSRRLYLLVDFKRQLGCNPSDLHHVVYWNQYPFDVTENMRSAGRDELDVPHMEICEEPTADDTDEDRIAFVLRALLANRDAILAHFPLVARLWRMRQLALGIEAAARDTVRSTAFVNLRLILEPYDLAKREKPAGETGQEMRFVVPLVGRRELRHRVVRNGAQSDWHVAASGRSFNCALQFSVISAGDAEIDVGRKTFYADTSTLDASSVDVSVPDSFESNAVWSVQLLFQATGKQRRLVGIQLVHDSAEHPTLVEYLTQHTLPLARPNVLSLATVDDNSDTCTRGKHYLERQARVEEAAEEREEREKRRRTDDADY